LNHFWLLSCQLGHSFNVDALGSFVSQIFMPYGKFGFSLPWGCRRTVWRRKLWGLVVCFPHVPHMMVAPVQLRRLLGEWCRNRCLRQTTEMPMQDQRIAAGFIWVREMVLKVLIRRFLRSLYSSNVVDAQHSGCYNQGYSCGKQSECSCGARRATWQVSVNFRIQISSDGDDDVLGGYAYLGP